MKYYIIAGEASGDLHAARLMREIRRIDAAAGFRGFGGDRMEAAGASLAKHIRELAFMGIWEVVKNLRSIRKNFALCRKDLLDFAPDVLLLVDYPGFNLNMAKFARNHNIRVFYYIAPKIWAWKENRIHRIKKYVEKLFVIFPFEVDFYEKHRYPVLYEGNPLVDEVRGHTGGIPSRRAFLHRHRLSEKPVIALIPGSRLQELKWILPEMVRVAPRFPEYQFVVSGVPTLPPAVYAGLMGDDPLPVVTDATYDLMHHAEAALVTSGTATLETALFGTPQVVVYKTSPVTYFIGKPFVRIRFFSLVNIIMQRQVVKELLQKNLADGMEVELRRILTDGSCRNLMLDDYQTLHAMLGEPGVAERVARRMTALLQPG